MSRKNTSLVSLHRIARNLVGARPLKAYELLYQAFIVFAATGDTGRAVKVIRLAYRPEWPAPSEAVHALGTGPMDGFLRAGGLPDITRGLPVPTSAQREGLTAAMDREERAQFWEQHVRFHLTLDAYSHVPVPVTDWHNLEAPSLWRRAQALARPLPNGALRPTELDALAALTKYIDTWCDEPERRGAGYGAELLLGIDLSLRHDATIPARWLQALGSKLLTEHRIEGALCLPVVARWLVDRQLRDVVALSDTERADALTRIEVALDRALPTAAATRLVPGQKIERTVSCDYSQFYLQHAEGAHDTLYFQDEREHAQAMSVFPDHVAIGTPVDTLQCNVVVTVEPSAPAAIDLGGAVQAVAFPFKVRGPLFLRWVGSAAPDDEPFEVAAGDYDVLVVFRTTSSAARPRSGLRSFAVTMTFFPHGSIAAPRCLKLEGGPNPAAIFVHRVGG